ncbi:MAG: hypothetical protein AAGG69_10160, partial [Pseudomonadota bacterium]
SLRSIDHMKVYLHVGYHKTGTTSFQGLLQANESRFSQGFEAHTVRSDTLHGISGAFVKYHHNPSTHRASELKGMLAALRQACVDRGCTKLLISDENFIGIMPRKDKKTEPYPNRFAAMELMLEAFAHDDVEVFLTTRDYRAWLDSVYRHQLRKRGIRGGIEKFAQLPKFAGLTSVDEMVAELTGWLPDHVPVTTSRLEATKPDHIGPHLVLLKQIDPSGDLFSTWQAVDRENDGLNEASMRRMQSPFLLLLPDFLRWRYARHLVRNQHSDRHT